MKTSKKAEPTTNGAMEWTSADPFIFGASLNDVDLAFRGGIYAIRPSRSGVNPKTGLPTHGNYCLQKFEILSGDFTGEIRTRSYYVGGLAGSIPKGSPMRPLLVPSVDNQVPVGGLTSEQIVALAIGELAFDEEDFPNYEGKFLIQPKGHNMPLREDSQYGQLVTSVKNLYKPAKNATPQEIAYGTTFPGIIAGNTGPDFALNYGFHFRLEGDEFKTLIAVSALGLIPPTEVTQEKVQTPIQVAATPTVASTQVAATGANGSGYTVESVRPLIYQGLMKGPRVKNELITELMNTATGDKNSLVSALLAPGAFDSDLWALGADGKYALK